MTSSPSRGQWSSFACLVVLIFMPAIAGPARAVLIGIHETGIAFGNPVVHRGLRVGWSDRGVQTVDGLNAIIASGDRGVDQEWWSKPTVNSQVHVRGISLGLLAMGQSLDGAGLGLAVGWRERVNGLTIGLANLTKNLNGIGLGFLNGVGDARGAVAGGMFIGRRASGLVIGGVGISAVRVDGLALGGLLCPFGTGA